LRLARLVEGDLAETAAQQFVGCHPPQGARKPEEANAEEEPSPFPSRLLQEKQGIAPAPDTRMEERCSVGDEDNLLRRLQRIRLMMATRWVDEAGGSVGRCRCTAEIVRVGLVGGDGCWRGGVGFV